MAAAPAASAANTATRSAAWRRRRERALHAPSARDGLPPGPRAPALRADARVGARADVGDGPLRAAARRGVHADVLAERHEARAVSDPEAVKTVFTAPPELAPSAAGNSPVRPVMGAELGARADRRRAHAPAQAAAAAVPRRADARVRADDRARRRAPTWRAGRCGEPMRLQERTRAITLEVILRAVFGVEAERMDGAARGDRRAARADQPAAPARDRAQPADARAPDGRVRTRARPARRGRSTTSSRAAARSRTWPSARTSSRC